MKKSSQYREGVLEQHVNNNKSDEKTVERFEDNSYSPFDTKYYYMADGTGFRTYYPFRNEYSLWLVDYNIPDLIITSELLGKQSQNESSLAQP